MSAIPAGGSGTNPTTPYRFRFFTLAMESKAFNIPQVPFSEAAPAPLMRVHEEILGGTKLDILAGKPVIIVPLGAADPFRSVALYITDADGHPRYCVHTLGEIEAVESDPTAKAEAVFFHGAKYGVLWSNDQSIAMEYWNELTSLVRKMGLTAKATTTELAAAASKVRLAVEAFAKHEPFFIVEAKDMTGLAPAMPLNAPAGNWFDYRDGDGAAWAKGKEADYGATLVLSALLHQQAGLKPSHQYGLIHHSTIGVLASRLGSSVASKFAYDPSGARASYFVMARRPAIGALYVAEFVDRELRRRRRNTAWAQLGLGKYRGYADAARNNQPIAALHTALLEVLELLHAGTAGAQLAELQRKWVYDIAEASRNITDASTINEIASAVAALTVPSTAGNTFRADDAKAKLLSLTKYKAVESPLFLELWDLYYPGAHRGQGFLRGLVGTSTAQVSADAAKVESAAKVCASYFQEYLYGFAWKCMVPTANQTGTIESLVSGDQVNVELRLKEYKTAIRTLLDDRCGMDQITLEATVQGLPDMSEFDDLSIRLLMFRMNWGGDWWKIGLPPSVPLAQKVVTQYLRPASGFVSTVAKYYQMASETVIWNMLEGLGGPKADPAKVFAQVQGHIRGVMGYMNWIQAASTQEKFAFGIVTHIAFEEVFKGVAVTIAEKNLTTGQSKSLNKILCTVLAMDPQAEKLLTKEVAQSLSKQTADAANARIMQAPAYLSAFVGVAGTALTLADFGNRWNAQTNAFGQAALVAGLTRDVAGNVANIANAIRVTLLHKGTATLLSGATGAADATGGALRYYALAKQAGAIATKATKVAEGVGAVLSVYQAGDLFLNPESALNRAGEAGDIDTYKLQTTKGLVLTMSAGAAVAGLTGALALSVTGPIGLACGVTIMVIDWKLSDIKTEYYTLRTQTNEMFQNEYVYDSQTRRYQSKFHSQLSAFKAVTIDRCIAA